MDRRSSQRLRGDSSSFIWMTVRTEGCRSGGGGATRCKPILLGDSRSRYHHPSSQFGGRNTAGGLSPRATDRGRASATRPRCLLGRCRGNATGRGCRGDATVVRSAVAALLHATGGRTSTGISCTRGEVRIDREPAARQRDEPAGAVGRERDRPRRAAHERDRGRRVSTRLRGRCALHASGRPEPGELPACCWAGCAVRLVLPTARC